MFGPTRDGFEFPATIYPVRSAILMLFDRRTWDQSFRRAYPRTSPQCGIEGYRIELGAALPPRGDSGAHLAGFVEALHDD
jgi:hypothetical protein